MFEWIPFIRRKCFICGVNDDNVIRNCYTKYGETHFKWYHEECLKKIIVEPSNNLKLNEDCKALIEKILEDTLRLEQSKKELSRFVLKGKTK